MSDNREDLANELYAGLVNRPDDWISGRDDKSSDKKPQEQSAKSYYETKAAERAPRWYTDYSVGDEYDLQEEYVDDSGNILFVNRCAHCKLICGYGFQKGKDQFFCYNCMLCVIECGNMLGARKVPDAKLIRRLYNQDGTCRNRTWRWSLEQSAFMNFVRDTIKKFS